MLWDFQICISVPLSFFKILLIKRLLLYLRYFCFKGADFSRVKLKVVPKLLRESSVSDEFFVRVSLKSLLSNFL